MGTRVPKGVRGPVMYMVGLICFNVVYITGGIVGKEHFSSLGYVLYTGVFILGILAYRDATIKERKAGQRDD